MAGDMENVLDMSLDDYIASFKKEKETTSSPAGDRVGNECKFKAERRRQNDNDEDRMEAETNGIWKGPDADTNFIDLDYAQDDFEMMLSDPDSRNQSPFRKNKKTQNSQKELQVQRYSPNFDLREKICANQVPNSNSQQWRLMQPNVINQRPAGMPPLVPQNSMQDRQKWKNKFSNWGNNNNNNSFGRKWGNQRNFNNGNNQNKNNSNMLNSGRVQRQRNSNQDCLEKNIKAVIDRLNASNGHLLPQDVRDLTIQVPSAAINFTGNACRTNSEDLHSKVTMNSLQPAARNLLDGTANSIKGSNSLRELLGINDTNTLKTEMMPMLASKFLDFLQNGSQQTIHKPIYDIKLQKEIHEIQRKPLMYKCPGGEVVSSDGSGINNCEIIPRTSGMSLNHRFA